MHKYLFPKLSIFIIVVLNTFQIKDANACTGHDLVITDITFTSINTENNITEYAYTYKIKNIGTASIALNQLVIQNYVSTDNEEGNDVAAGGSYIDIHSTDAIAAGAVYTGTMSANVDANHATNSYPYLLVEVYLNSETECDITNNNYFSFIQLNTPTGVVLNHVASATVNWNSDDKSFTVSRWSGNSLILQYTIFNAAGIKVFSGSVTEEQTVALSSLQAGIYIIYLSDGSQIYSKKIVF